MPKYRNRLAALLVALGVLLAAGLVYEEAGRRDDARRFRQIGHSIDIGDRTLNIHCVGDGTPTVVFDTSSHQAGYSWIGIQSQVAEFTRACWYDRAGYGWSAPASGPRTFRAVAQDLNALLKGASIPAPFVLVGAGEAGLHIVVYNGLYPSDVAGVVLADSAGIADSEMEEPEFLQGPWARHFGSWAPLFRSGACAVLLPVAHRLGVSRLFWQFQGSRRTPSFGLTREQQKQLDFLSDNPTAKAGGELCDREESLSQVRAASDLGDRPLIVLASQRRIGLRPREPEHARAVEEYNKNWIDKVQPQLAALSTRGRVVTVEIWLPTAVQESSLDRRRLDSPERLHTGVLRLYAASHVLDDQERTQAIEVRLTPSGGARRSHLSIDIETGSQHWRVAHTPRDLPRQPARGCDPRQLSSRRKGVAVDRAVEMVPVDETIRNHLQAGLEARSAALLRVEIM